MLMAYPMASMAQDEFEEEEVAVVAKKKVQAVKKYETRDVKGTVLDAATGAPVTGAIVKVTGVDGYSVMTNQQGEYTIKVPLFASSLYIGSTDFNSTILGLTEGVQQKSVKLISSKFAPEYREETNILNSVTASDFKYSNAINIKDEVQKQLGAYAYTTQRSGTPGIGATMFIQGLNSLNANAQPLVVIDGVVQDQQYSREMIHEGFYNDPLSAINPADIDNVTILRNGTALYGAKGANGVIEIRTKRSHSMATRITASVSAGVSFEPKHYNMMDAEGYRGYASELLKGTDTRVTEFKFLNNDPNYYYYNQYHNNTDWKKEVFRTALTQNYGINVEGGDNTAMYNLSVGYTDAKSSLKCNDMSRLNIRFNTDVQFLDKLGVRFDASFSNTTRDIRDDGAPRGYDEGTPTAPSFLAYAKAPFLSPMSYGNDANGRGVLSDTFLDITDESYLSEALSSYSNYNWKLANPTAINEYAEAEEKNRFENSVLNISIAPKYDILRNLSIRELFSYTLTNTKDKYYLPVNGVPTFYVAGVSANRENQVSNLAAKQNSLQSDTRIDWNQRYNAHAVKLIGGVRLNFENYTRSYQNGYNTGTDKTPLMNNTSENRTADGVDETWRDMNVYVQGNYDYLGRYFAQVNLSAAGSSRFGRNADGGVSVFGATWGLFPSLQGSWVVTNEPWLAGKKGLDYLKFTMGYDISGNDDIDIYARRSYFASYNYLNAVAGLSIAGIGNDRIKWETTRRFNLGFETRLLDNRLSLAFNYFNSSTVDLLAMKQLSVLSGVASNWDNNGRLRNVGFDVNLGMKIINTKDWGFNLGLSAGHYSNTIVNLGLQDGKKSFTTDICGATILTREGSAANLFYGYRTNGVFATAEQAEKSGLYILNANGVTHDKFGAGDVIFVDQNGDKEINERDMVVIGNPNPDLYGNIAASLTWKRFKLDANFSYSIGNDVYNYMRAQLEGGSRFMNQTTALTRRWQAEGQVTDIPKITFQDPMGNSRFSDRWIEDGSYMKLKSVTVSYDLPINSTFLQGLQFWIQGNNLFTLTRYLGTDPEVSATNSVIGQGIDLGRIGQSRSIVAGVKINL